MVLCTRIEQENQRVTIEEYKQNLVFIRNTFHKLLFTSEVRYHLAHTYGIIMDAWLYDIKFGQKKRT